MDMTVIFAASPLSFSRSAASTAFSSKPLTTGGIPGAGTTFFASESMLKAEAGVSGSITCFTHTIMLIAMDSLYSACPNHVYISNVNPLSIGGVLPSRNPPMQMLLACGLSVK